MRLSAFAVAALCVVATLSLVVAAASGRTIPGHTEEETLIVEELAREKTAAAIASKDPRERILWLFADVAPLPGSWRMDNAVGKWEGIRTDSDGHVTGIVLPFQGGPEATRMSGVWNSFAMQKITELFPRMHDFNVGGHNIHG
jgi:hypothetical protein